MKKALLIPFIVLCTSPVSAENMMVRINVNRFCAAVVGIPYASDNFSDDEWKKFKNCVRFVRKFDGIE